MPKALPPDSTHDSILQTATSRVRNDTSLEAAKQQVAENYGFLTWRQLDLYLDIAEDERIDFDHLACLSYVWWEHPSRREQARKMLKEDPSLEHRSIYTACTTGTVKLVEEFLHDEPDLLNRRGGYLDWEPLLYACYSRLNLPDRSTSDVVQLLLDRGANSNAYYRWGGIYVFSALTGVFGEGERGPINQPEHPDFRSLAKRLLEAGADCNDSQALYNRMFRPDNTALNMLLEYGLTKNHACNWNATVEGRLLRNPVKTLDYQLQWAVKSNFEERVAILLEHGADATQKLKPEGRLAKLARTRGFNVIADNLEAHGAKRYKLTKVEQFLNYCLDADVTNAREMLATRPNLIKRANKKDPEAMNRASDVGNVAALELMLDLGFDVHGAAAETPLHHATHNGHLELAKRLLARGASLYHRDPFYLSTPLGWAQAGNNADMVAYLQQHDLDLFDWINTGDVEKVRNYLDRRPESLNTPLRSTLADELKQHNSAWQTPLAYAAIRDKADVVRLLLDHGANRHIQADDGTQLQNLCNPAIGALLQS